MRRWLIIPAKPFDEAKSRLAGVLCDSMRALLSAHLLERTLRTAVKTRLFEHIVVVSRDPAALALASAFDAVALTEEVADLNTALAQACTHARVAGADAALLLPADLPQLRSEDLHELVAAFSDRRTVVLAPSRDGGTNALLLTLPAPFPFAFGPDSWRVHQMLATTAGFAVVAVHSATLSFDLDSPADLQELAVDPSFSLQTLSPNQP